MRMRKKARVEAPPPVGNPVQLLMSFDPMSETSVILQTETRLAIKGSGIISHVNEAMQPRAAFSMIVTCLMYCPGRSEKITCSDHLPPQPDGTPGSTRNYTNLYQFSFGNGYKVGQFLLNAIPPATGEMTIVLKHAACKRRIVFADLFANLDPARNPIDQVAFNGSRGKADGNIDSRTSETTTDPYEMIYGVVAVGGQYTNYTPPLDYLVIRDVGTKIDQFDTTLKTYYKLVSRVDTFRMGASISGTDYTWGAAVQTFRSAIL